MQIRQSRPCSVIRQTNVKITRFANFPIFSSEKMANFGVGDYKLIGKTLPQHELMQNLLSNVPRKISSNGKIRFCQTVSTQTDERFASIRPKKSQISIGIDKRRGQNEDFDIDEEENCCCCAQTIKKPEKEVQNNVRKQIKLFDSRKTVIQPPPLLNKQQGCQSRDYLNLMVDIRDKIRYEKGPCSCCFGINHNQFEIFIFSIIECRK